MSLRRKGRELALQILYQWDIHRDTSGWLEDFWAQNPTHSEAKTFAEGLVDGVITHAGELDSLLGRYAEHWRRNGLSRLRQSGRSAPRPASIQRASRRWSGSRSTTSLPSSNPFPSRLGRRPAICT